MTVILTDHKPLLPILNNPAAKLLARLERLCLRLMAYRLRTSFIDGASNPADYASRHPTEPADSKSADTVEGHVRFVAEQALPRAITLHEVKAATADDPVLSKVAECISTGDWRDAYGKAEFQPYVNVKSELALRRRLQHHSTPDQISQSISTAAAYRGHSARRAHGH